ncbi:c-type cytochrome [Roseateles terrae]
MTRKVWIGVGGLMGVLALIAAWVVWLNVRGEAPLSEAMPSDGRSAAQMDARSDARSDTRSGATLAKPSQASIAALMERGAYLAHVGNCMGCHTTTGGEPYAGGRRIDTPFGVVVSPNLTSDAATGLGRWTASEFWRALHHGRSRDGRLLSPAFPYPSYTTVTREDSDALWAYLQSVPAVARANEPHELRFPYNTQAALAVWRALYFRAEEFRADPAQTEVWNRGRYLVQGLGHCASCHSARNALGGSSEAQTWAGAVMPDGAWYAPSLLDRREAGVQHLSREQVVKLLNVGTTDGAAVSGPMAEVVFMSTQFMSESDLAAMADYLKTLPEQAAKAPKRPEVSRGSAESVQRGGKLYSEHCATCHGAAGEGVTGQYPPLAGNRAVTLPVINNLVQMIRHGGFAPATAGNPRPFGMPPYGQTLSDAQIADLATYLRQSWGHEATAVAPLDVLNADPSR